ncbi:class I SAM-dependent methyltransferase [Rhodanobacter sp. BL-MT-08]
MKEITDRPEDERVFSPDQQAGSANSENGVPEFDISWLGLVDAGLSGWYLSDSDEVFQGVPISAGDVVVDVGCGDGGAVLFCAERGAEVIAVDIDADVIADIAARLANSSASAYATHVSDSDPLPLADGIATRVICSEVLEHVDDPARVLSELVRIGKPGAIYLLTVPDPLHETMQKHVAPDAYFEKPNHIRIIERQQFADMVRQTGLIVREQRYYGFYWGMWWALFWACGVELGESHPVLDNWSATWKAVLKTRRGVELKRKLDQFMPKSQLIVAHKPQTDSPD